MYHTLHDALQSVQTDQLIVAEDISKCGKKQFYTGNVDTLNTLYSSLTRKHWYECLVENRPSRIFLDVESEHPVDIRAIVAVLKQCVQQKYKITPLIQVMDSCSPTKNSWHLVCTNVVLRNVYQVGAFVRRLVLFMDGSEMRNAIDTAVYTKNRMFRIKDSSKFNSTRILKHGKEWFELLVQPLTNTVPLECLEIDNSCPVSTSMPPEKLFIETARGTWVRAHSHRLQRGQISQSHCPMLTTILDWLDRTVDAKTCRHNTKMLDTGHYFVMTRSKKCEIAKRSHRGNNIWFNIDVIRQKVVQRCFDQECCRSSEEYVVDVPSEVWLKWTTTWSEIVRTPSGKRNENTLYNMTF